MNQKNPEKISIIEEMCKNINLSKLELKQSKRKTQLPVRFQNDYEIQTLQYGHR